MVKPGESYGRQSGKGNPRRLANTALRLLHSSDILHGRLYEEKQLGMQGKEGHAVKGGGQGWGLRSQG